MTSPSVGILPYGLHEQPDFRYRCSKCKKWFALQHKEERRSKQEIVRVYVCRHCQHEETFVEYLRDPRAI